MHSFIVGQTYNRQRDIHLSYAGQEQGGISTPTSVPFIFLFTSDAGAAFGYENKFQLDGVYWYTGEGQLGDMQMTRGNAAICKHGQDEKLILIFEYVSNGDIRFLGEAEYLGHHFEERPDRDGTLRQAIVFHLGLLSTLTSNLVQESRKTYGPQFNIPNQLSLAELRRLATEVIPKNSSQAERLINLRIRSEAIRKYALKRANGMCEGCNSGAPFKAKSGPFLEVHHVFRLADGGPDHPANVTALCPNCHRRVHHSIDAESYNQTLIRWLQKNEAA